MEKSKRKEIWRKSWRFIAKSLMSVIIGGTAIVLALLVKDQISRGPNYYRSGHHARLHRYRTSGDSDMLKGDNLSARIGRFGDITIIDETTGKATLKNVRFDWSAKDDKDSLSVFCYDDKRGYFNSYTGQVAIQPQYRRAWFFSCGLAGVQKDGMIGFIDHQGNTVIDFKFPYYGNPLSEFVFHDGVCVVADETGRCGVIDTLGNWLVRPEYKHVYAYKDYAIVTNPGILMMVDYSGNILDNGLVDYISPLDYRFTERYVRTDGTIGEVEESRSTGMFVYYVGGLCGLMDSQGHRITPPLYGGLYAESENLFSASLRGSGAEVILNRQGKVVN